jgi:hypothetical protein
MVTLLELMFLSFNQKALIKKFKPLQINNSILFVNT